MWSSVSVSKGAWHLLGTALILSLSGCGYSLAHRLKEPFADAKGVFVPVFTNLTDETGAEKVFTNAVIRELQSRGGIKITDRASGARELRGVLTGISYGPTTYTEVGFKGLQPYRRLPSEVAVTVSLALELVDPGTGRVLWTSSFSALRRVEPSLARTQSYEAVSSFGSSTLSLIEFRYNDIARDISRDVYDDMVELFW